MKKLLLVSSLIAVGFIVGCSSKDKAATTESESSTAVSQVGVINSNETSIKYETADKKEFILKTNDQFATATLMDSDGNTYALKEVPAGSGMLLEGENGVSVHSKGNEAIITLAKDVSVNVTEVK